MNTNIDFDNPLGFNPFSLKLPPFGTPFYTVEEYEAQLAAIIDGSLVIDNTVYENDAITELEFANLTVIYE